MKRQTETEIKKSMLLILAKNDEPRPAWVKPLGQCLNNYTSPSNSSYDKDFAQSIKRLRPEWFRKLESREL